MKDETYEQSQERYRRQAQKRTRIAQGRLEDATRTIEAGVNSNWSEFLTAIDHPGVTKSELAYFIFRMARRNAGRRAK